MTELARAYIIVRSNTIIGDSRTFLKGPAVNMSLIALCKAADRHHGLDVQMITYLPVETYTDRDTVYEVYRFHCVRTEGIPVQAVGYSPEATAMVRSKGTFIGYVRCIQALWD